MEGDGPGVGVGEDGPERHLLRVHALALVDLEARAHEARVEGEGEALGEGHLAQLVTKRCDALRLLRERRPLSLVHHRPHNSNFRHIRM